MLLCLQYLFHNNDPENINAAWKAYVNDWERMVTVRDSLLAPTVKTIKEWKIHASSSEIVVPGRRISFRFLARKIIIYLLLAEAF